MFNFSAILERNRERWPDREVIAYGDRRIDNRTLFERVNALARGMRELGIGRGAVVALLLYNCPEFLEVTFAVNKLGAVWLPLNYRLAAAEWRYILGHAGAEAIVTEPEFAPSIDAIAEELPALRHRVLVGAGADRPWIAFETLVEPYRGERVADAEVEEHDLQRLMYTSGTTARPKGVMITYGNLLWKNVGHILEFGITSSDRTLVAGPLYHVGGMDLPASAVLYAGGSLVLLRKFEAREALAAIQAEGITNLWLAPAMVNMVLQLPDLEAYDTRSVRFIINGGEKMPVPLIQRVLRAFPNAWFSDAYGLTETVSGDTFMDREHVISKIGSVGKPVVHLAVRVVDEEGQEVLPNQLGEVVLRGPKVFKGYWRDPEATAAAIRDGWFHTGDIGRIDEDGYLYIEDRKKDLIISGGENIASSEVERALYEHPAVVEAAVIGIPDPRWGEVPKAFVVLRSGAEITTQDLIEHCRQRLARFKVPKQVEFIDALPRNPSGKVLKRELRERTSAVGTG
ncbi:MAG TPA: long-chain fatty acid--CoA ligase [Candidatus Dormibacteraeota bacterium]|nr:long-chain fatty acid--CoA ligase [Candidatus Dormibacteraeota bacterium]